MDLSASDAPPAVYGAQPDAGAATVKELNLGPASDKWRVLRRRDGTWTLRLSAGEGAASTGSGGALPLESIQGVEYLKALRGGPPGPGFVESSSVITGASPPLASRSWTDEVRADLSYAPRGPGRAGWRFDSGFEASRDAWKARLSAPLAGAVAYGPSQCVGGGYSWFCLETATPVAISGVRLSSTGAYGVASHDAVNVQTDQLAQVTARYQFTLASSYGWATATPMGALDLRAGVKTRVSLTNSATRRCSSGQAVLLYGAVEIESFEGCQSVHEVGWDLAPSLFLEAAGRVGRASRFGWALAVDAGPRIGNDKLHASDGSSGHLVSIRPDVLVAGELRYFVRRGDRLFMRVERHLTSYIFTQQGADGANGSVLSGLDEVVRAKSQSTTSILWGTEFSF